MEGTAPLVLLVEPHDMTLALAALLVEAGFAVLHVESAQGAVEVLARGPSPRAVVVHVTPTDMDAAVHVLAAPALPRLPLIRWEGDDSDPSSLLTAVDVACRLNLTSLFAPAH